MNFKKYMNSDYLKSNPLCGIDTYKDELNLTTGACTRRIKKLVLDGTENWKTTMEGRARIFYISNSQIPNNMILCTHYVVRGWDDAKYNDNSINVSYTYARQSINIHMNTYSTVADFKSYLADQYAAGTPVTVWYVLATPTTETITVPSGLSGTEEGYLNQSGTPTPSNPIYPTANTVEQWFDINHYIMGTSTDTITTPADIYANDTTATVGLKGNMSQSSTPSPTTPIQPSECGELEENVAIIDNKSDTINNNYYKDIRLTDVLKAGTYTVSYSFNSRTGDAYTSSIGRGNSDTYLGDIVDIFVQNIPAKIVKTVTLTKDECIWARFLRSVTPSTFSYNVSNIRVEEGNVSYGIKIPISSANTTTPIYLGEVQTTRRIKKLVLDGTENWLVLDVYYTVSAPNVRPWGGCICTHCAYSGIIGGNDEMRLWVKQASFPDCQTLGDFKSYLAAQYAAGTPVTVWYSTVTPETAVINEPLRKIGDYVDTVSGITIPTITGKDSFDVLTTLKPSEVSLTYTGWHDAEVKEWDGSEWEGE